MCKLLSLVLLFNINQKRARHKILFDRNKIMFMIGIWAFHIAFCHLDFLHFFFEMLFYY